MKPRILFFISDSYPTPAEFAAAARIPTEMFRNASQVFPGVKPEPCDGVAGLVPESYQGFPLISTDEVPAVDNPPDFVPAAVAVEAAASSDPVAAQRAAEDEGARTATAAQLKAALDQLGIPHPGQPNKAALLALFLGRP